MIPAAIIIGIGAGPLWTAKCTYLTEIAGFYAHLSKEDNETVVNRFFGIFFAMFQISQIMGNLISSLVLKPDTANSTRILSVNQCGVKDCPGGPNSQIIRPQLSTVYSLCVIYLSLAFMSIVLIRYSLKSYKNKEVYKNDEPKNESKFDLLIKTITQLKNPYQLLIIPLTLWLGFSLAFIGADFTKSFVACAKGVDSVGFAMICFGLTDVLGSYLFGQMVKYVGRIPCFITGALINYAVIYLMLIWEVNLDEDYVFYLIPLFWGLADAAWQTQVNSIYGVLFKSNKEAAFSNFRLWESLGFAISYAYSNTYCLSVKLNLLLVYLTIGMIGYLIIEFMENRELVSRHRLFFIFKSKTSFVFLSILIILVVFLII